MNLEVLKPTIHLKGAGEAVTAFAGHQSLKKQRNAKVVFTTDSSLLQVWGEDKTLRNYRYVVVDEAHERSLSTDLILAAMKQTMRDEENLRKGKGIPPLNIVITSATIEPEVFARYFEDFSVSIINVRGKIYPVKAVYSSAALTLEFDYVRAVAEKVEEIVMTKSGGEGGILAFLADPAQAERAVKILEESDSAEFGRATFYVLHGKLPLEEQQRVFQHEPGPQIHFCNAHTCWIILVSIQVIRDK